MPRNDEPPKMPPPDGSGNLKGKKMQPKTETVKGPCYEVTIQWNANHTAWRTVRAVYHFDHR